ncbi:hypothetical protein SIN8267_01376 [Sinobacterium norvegicum]|uniref:Uncharacterized protein n=1 Tax=Sinobacterium norvegicum TaxID=1641715 RepID=A0ABN8EFT2_9GAMM|nr:hypothetical protein [Sinobacterium norvegicum]CAH0991274.1 hypothetical protein SIN8267_01376 [Sinobacterium norvegicum]
MNLPQLRTLYEIGRLSDVVVFHSDADHQWHLDCHDLWGHTLHVTTPKGDNCHFTSSDKAMMAAKSIGFSRVVVQRS